jgi:hypothetical protein
MARKKPALKPAGRSLLRALERIQPTMKLAESLAELGVDGSVCFPTSFDELVVEIEKALSAVTMEPPLAGALPDFPPYRDFKTYMDYLGS